MRLRPWHALLLCTLALAGSGNPAAAQETRILEGPFTIEITDSVWLGDAYFVTFVGGGTADALGGDFVITYGQYLFHDDGPLHITDGFMEVATEQGSFYCYFQGDAVFTGGLTGELYISGGTGIYENAEGVVHIDALFGRYGFTFGRALFVWYGEITY